MYTLFMTIDDKEYALFSYKPQSRRPPLSSWKPEQNVCTVQQNGKCIMDNEFFTWVSYNLFPYDIYEDHTHLLNLQSYAVPGFVNKIIPQRLQFKDMKFF